MKECQLSLKLPGPDVQFVLRSVVYQQHLDRVAAGEAKDALDAAAGLLGAVIGQDQYREQAHIALIEQRGNLARGAIQHSIDFDARQNHQVGAMWVIFDAISGVFDDFFQSIRAVVLAAIAQLIALMRKCQDICGDAMVNWTCRHYFLLHATPASQPEAAHRRASLWLSFKLFAIHKTHDRRIPVPLQARRLTRMERSLCAGWPGRVLWTGSETRPLARGLVAHCQPIAAWIGSACKKLARGIEDDCLSVAHRIFPGAEHMDMMAESG